MILKFENSVVELAKALENRHANRDCGYHFSEDIAIGWDNTSGDCWVEEDGTIQEAISFVEGRSHE